jgi:hypothetical protein
VAGRTGSPYSLGERKQKAFRRFNRGQGPSDVYKKLGVSYDTACRYYREWKKHAGEAARQDPDFLRDILGNTWQAIAQIDEVRRVAWAQISKKGTNPQTKQSLLNTILKAEEQRNKILSVLGIRQEVFVYLQNFQKFQQLLIGFLKKELCDVDKEKLIEFLQSEEVRPFIGVEEDAFMLPAIEGEVVEDSA